ncbi:17199_t:CDS:1, partial [Racocetra fulgida]
VLTEQYMISSGQDMTLSGVGNSIYIGTDVSAQSTMNSFMKHTSPVIFDTSSLNTNSIPNLSLSNTLPMYTNNPLNPNLSTPLYEKYLAKTDFNANNAFNGKINFNVNNAFNNQTSPNLPIVNTSTSSNIFTNKHRPLPENWIQEPTEDGNAYYYFNTVTQELRWTYPDDEFTPGNEQEYDTKSIC